jgi:hypothetical protein
VSGARGTEEKEIRIVYNRFEEHRQLVPFPG